MPRKAGLEKPLFRVRKDPEPSGKWVSQRQSGAGGRVVTTVREETYEKSKRAANTVLQSTSDGRKQQ